jgi:hypothetical protein
VLDVTNCPCGGGTWLEIAPVVLVAVTPAVGRLGDGDPTSSSRSSGVGVSATTAVPEIAGCSAAPAMGVFVGRCKGDWLAKAVGREARIALGVAEYSTTTEGGGCPLHVTRQPTAVRTTRGRRKLAPSTFMANHCSEPAHLPAEETLDRCEVALCRSLD